MWDLKINTAKNWPIFVRDINGQPVTGLVSGNFTSYISKNGANFGAMTVTITEMTGGPTGMYQLALDTGHTDTLGPLTVICSTTNTITRSQWNVVTRTSDDLAYPTTSGRALNVSAAGAADADLKLWLAAAPAALTANGYVQAMLLRWLTDNAGGTPNALISGRVDANAQVVGDKTGYALTQTFPTNFSSLSIDASGRVDLVKVRGTTINTLISGRIDANAQVVGDKTDYELSAGDKTALIAALLDTEVEAAGSTSLQEILMALLAHTNKASGGGTTTLVYTSPDGTKNRITQTVTAGGNRTVVTYDFS